MDTAIAFVEFLLGFAPTFIIVVTVVTAFWAATKLFPKFGAAVDAMFEGLFGVDADYDEKHKTGYTKHSYRR